MNENQSKKERFINIEEVVYRTSLKKSTIYDLMKRGKFPKSLSIALNRVVWLESEIDHWIEQKINASLGN